MSCRAQPDPPPHRTATCSCRSGSSCIRSARAWAAEDSFLPMPASASVGGAECGSAHSTSLRFQERLYGGGFGTLIPECLIVYHAAALDAAPEMYLRCLTRDLEDGLFTARDPVLGKQLYKGRSV